MAAQALQGGAAARPVRRIQPSRGFVGLDVDELWRFRGLLYFLVWRDVKSRYKQTFLGAFWAILRPFVSMVVFTVIFGRLVGIEPGSDVPYPLFVFSGLMVWLYFASAIGAGTASIVGNVNLITKASFPRLYVPTAAVAAPLVDLVLAFAVLLGMFAWYARLPSWHVVFLPFLVVLVVLAALGVSLWLAAATVRYRDIPFALGFATQLWMYATPVIYPVTLVPDSWRWLLALNPLTGVVDGFRWSVIGGAAPGGGVLAGSIGITLALVVGGLVFFRRVERTFADVI
jgi:lipopolysaccharide transport system permease protein